MIKRAFGKTEDMLTILGFGGIVVMNEDQRDANNYVSEAIDHGINYFDVAPGYGNAQEKLGPSLEPYRNNIFLACKTNEWSKDLSQNQLEDSLKKLRTDHFDLYQFHAVTTLEDVEKIFGPNGAMETFLRARKEGKIRYIGFSVHSEEAAQAMFDRYDFDSVLFPLNWASRLKNSFGSSILDRAVEKGAARLALKAMAKTNWSENLKKEDREYKKCWYEPISDEALASLALRYTLSQPVTSALPPGEVNLFRLAMKTAENFLPLSAEEEEVLRTSTEGLEPIFPIKK